MANGYFEFRNNGKRLEIVLFQPPEGGRRISIEDVMHCADKAMVTGFDVAFVNKSLINASGNTVITIGDAVIPFRSWCEYSISDDGMTVTAVRYPGFEGMQQIERSEILSELGNKGIVYGIAEEGIDSLLLSTSCFEKITVARGIPPKAGTDAVLTYLFDADKKAKPTIREDGSVDFRNLDGLNHVKAGDAVAAITPEVSGTPGTNVFGKTILPSRVKRAIFKHGRNLKPSEDGLKLISEVSGHVSLEGDKIFVSNVFEVVDVDNSTGNIDYDGDVVISGNVLAGFTVKAAGNIEVRGIVEGATLDAGGDIFLIRGVQGMNKAEITCKGNMVTKFIESAESINVGGNLETDTILHSRVNVKGHINAQGKNGLIIGGDVKSIHGITAKTIGNAMGTATIVGAGVDPSLKKQIDKLKKDIVSANENREKLSQIISVLCKKREMEGKLEPEKVTMLQKTTMNIAMLDQEIKNMRNTLEESEQLIIDDENASIRVSRTIYSGTKIMFGDVYMYLKTKADYCQFVKKGADIKIFPL